MSQALRSMLVVLVGIAAILLAANAVVHSPTYHVPKDFPEYWAAGRLNLHGENPYDPVKLLAEQRTADPDRSEAVMMWNPPPTLAAYMLLGWLPIRWAALLWVVVQFVAVMLACDLLWRVYSPTGPRWLAQIVGLSFAGTWWLVAYGQNTGFLLLGLAGFLYFISRGKPLATGASAALTAFKPHLLAGYGVVLLADALTRRGRLTVITGIGVIVVSLGAAVLANPAVINQFVAAVRDPGSGAVPLHGWALPVPAYWLRMAVAPNRFWVQFVPCVAGCASLVAWRWHAGEAWNWSWAMPVVVAVSVLTTPYGGWIFDLPVLLVPVIWCAARLTHHRGLLAVFLASQVTVTVVSLANPGGLHEYWWVAPAVLGLCLLGFHRRDSRGNLNPPGKIGSC